MKITKATIKTAEPRAERYWIWDELVPGLGMIVLPSGIKSWVLRYRTVAGKQRTHTLGRCAEMHPDLAREAALEILRQSRGGEDPTLARRQKRENPAISTLAVEFAGLHYPLCKPGTVANYKGYWKNHILPRFGHMRVDQLTAAGIREMRVEYRDKAVTFNRVREMLAVALDVAIEHGWCTENVARGRKMRDYRERARRRVMTEAEAPRLGRALEAFGTQSDIRWRFSALVTLLLITGCRLRELMHARWEWIDIEARTIAWPDTKTGEDETVLSEAAVALLEELKRRAPGSEWVFPGQRFDRPMEGYRKYWLEVCAAAKIEGLRIHDLRKSFASIALAEGVALEVIAGLLRHADPSITAQRYAFLMKDFAGDVANKAASAALLRLRS
jgi:integrase